MVLFKRVEFWIGSTGSWCRPEEWVFSFDRNCSNGCFILELGWWGITWYMGDCKIK